MANPDDGQNDAWHKHICPHHHKKADPHYQRHRDDDAQLGLHRHSLFLYKGLQVLFVKLGAHKPVVQLLRGICKAEHRHKKKGTVGRMGSTTPTQPSPKLIKPNIKNINRFSFIYVPLSLTHSPLLYGIDGVGNAHGRLAVGNQHHRFALPFFAERF